MHKQKTIFLQRNVRLPLPVFGWTENKARGRVVNMVGAALLLLLKFS